LRAATSQVITDQLTRHMTAPSFLAPPTIHSEEISPEIAFSLVPLAAPGPFSLGQLLGWLIANTTQN